MHCRGIVKILNVWITMNDTNFHIRSEDFFVACINAQFAKLLTAIM